MLLPIKVRLILETWRLFDWIGVGLMPFADIFKVYISSIYIQI